MGDLKKKLYPIPSHIQPEWKPLLQKGLAEDGWPWDWTSEAVQQPSDRIARAKILAKSNGVWAAAGLVPATQALAKELSEERGLKPLSLKSAFADGQSFKRGDVLVQWEGPVELILALERPFLNLASFACGIATQASTFVAQLKKAKCQARIVLTRKTLPFYRDLSIHAVRAGGGRPHRVGLSSGVLIKENHIAFAGGIRAAVEKARDVAPHLCKIEVEVRDLSELKEALDAKADVVLLDNFTPALVKRALKEVSQSLHLPLIEISGGVNVENVKRYALPGVDIISVGSLTHSVKSSDLSLLLDS